MKNEESVCLIPVEPHRMKGNIFGDFTYDEIPESGSVFGRLTILGSDSSNHRYWICRCDCGTIHRANKYSIRNMKTKSCGCYMRECMSARKSINLSGMRFGRLLVLNVAYRQDQKIYWNCICDCGMKTIAYGGSLRSGDTKSCGCWKSDLTSTRNYRHGMSRIKLYSVWCSMKDRCYSPKCDGYHRYGGRGILVCDEWLHDFEEFSRWSLENGYMEGLTIDRIDNDGPYSPENCRWVTTMENSHNSTACKQIEYAGHRMCMAEWDRTLGFARGTVGRRLRGGMSISEALTTPQKHRKMIE